jgi:DMSO/TMAO reductase YedYZ molybdopterin-dependent catalytic subunit
MQEMPVIESLDTQRANRIPPNQRRVTDWPVLHFGGVPRIDPAKWTLSINGLVDRPQNLSLDGFKALPQARVYADIHCVTGWSRLDNYWGGVTSREVASIAGVQPGAHFVIIHAAPNFTTNLTLEDFLQVDVLFAMTHDDRPITDQHGGPVRLVVPRLYFWKSAKWVMGLEFTAYDAPGFWESNGYHNHGDPWLEERYS